MDHHDGTHMEGGIPTGRFSEEGNQPFFSWFHSLIERLSSRSPDTKSLPLSDLISSGDPLLATTHLKLSVSSLAATTAALNSNVGLVRCLSGDSWDSPMTNEQWIRLCAFVM